MTGQSQASSSPAQPAADASPFAEDEATAKLAALRRDVDLLARNGELEELEGLLDPPALTVSSLAAEEDRAEASDDMGSSEESPEEDEAEDADPPDAPETKGDVAELTPAPERDSYDGERQMFVVGMGASAGGLEALRALFPHLAPDSNMTYVVVQHLAPNHRSLLATLLDRETSMDVREAEDGAALKPNQIVVCPANRDVVVENNTLHLRKPRHAIGPKPSVDLFFSSLAENSGEYAIAIILSGTGSDGAHGMRADKANGGITFAQKPDTAKYNGTVDLIVPASEIAQQLHAITRLYPKKLVSAEPKGEALPTYDHILLQIRRVTDCDFSDYKTATIMRRIDRRMVAQHIHSLEDYATLLTTSREEVQALCKDILISVTSFFRDREAFETLGRHLPEVVAHKNDGDPLRLWVPGCATGEEVYTIAMMLNESLGDDINRYNVQLFGTDLDAHAIMVGRRGLYPEAFLDSMDETLLNRYFIRSGNTYQVVKALREFTVFARQNLIKDPPFLRIDLLSCRNLLIYFNSTLQRKAFELFHYVLNPGGYLFLGKSETASQATDLFEPVDKKWRLYRRRDAVSLPMADLGRRMSRAASGQEAAARTTAPSRPTAGSEAPPTMESRLVTLLARTFAPAAVVVDENLEVQQVYGDVSPYLRLPSGRPALNLLHLARDDLRASIRALLHRTFNEGISTQGHGVPAPGAQGAQGARLAVLPVETYSREGKLAAVCFAPYERPSRSRDEAEADKGDNERIRELEQELAANREHLQTVVEELETANEELQSVNEELQASNEELQSTNEELETSNEELQSTNEELITVNEELQVKSADLAAANGDLENIQNNVGFALILVDRQLRITRFTPAATSIFSVLPSDVGQVITSIPTTVALPGLRHTLLRVINDGDGEESEVVDEDRVYWMKVIPYFSDRR